MNLRLAILGFILFYSYSGICDVLDINEMAMEKFVLIGKMKAKPNCETRLEDVLKGLAEGTYTEPGCLFYALHRDIQDSSIFVLVEGWTSQQALETHLHTAHFMQAFPIIQSLIIGDPELSSLTPLAEGDKKGSLFGK